MPNEDFDWKKNDFTKLEIFFGKIEKVLEEFAEKHNLMISKYYHQFPSWDLMFRQPRGGVAKIEISKEGEDEVRIRASWWIDQAEPRIRYLYSSEGEMSSLEHKMIRDLLHKTFNRMLAWDKSFLKPIEIPCVRKGEVTKDKIKKDEERYPIPKID